MLFNTTNESEAYTAVMHPVTSLGTLELLAGPVAILVRIVRVGIKIRIINDLPPPIALVADIEDPLSIYRNLINYLSLRRIAHIGRSATGIDDIHFEGITLCYRKERGSQQIEKKENLFHNLVDELTS